MPYNPSQHQPISKPFGPSTFPMDARSQFYDSVNYKYRAYLNVAEALAYLTTPFRNGYYEIIINTGGVLSAGIITGGTNVVYWFSPGILDADLVVKPGVPINFTVATYADMLTAATGPYVLTIFVTAASQYNEPNEFYTYYPGKGIAYLGIDFNYTQ